MNLIEHFGLNVKPKLVYGKGMLRPLATAQLALDVWALRDKDVNCFVIKGSSGYIAVDAGYKNSPNTHQALMDLGIYPDKVEALFLTHLDIDHAGGADARSDLLYPNAKVYISKEEEKYLIGAAYRKQIGPYGCKLPIHLSAYHTLSAWEEVHVAGLTIQIIPIPGHTIGHSGYLIDGHLLFVGDCLVANDSDGYCFYDFWNADTQLCMRSLEQLEKLCHSLNIQQLYTAHSGVVPVDVAFTHRTETLQWKQKGFCFCKDAPADLYKDK